MTPVGSLPGLDDLALFVAVVRAGSLTKAAAERGISQPWASERITSLERRLGVPLLTRSTTGSRPTAAGTLVAAAADDVLTAVDRLLATVDAIRAERGGKLRVAASLTVAENLLPAWLVAMRRVVPDVHVDLVVGNSGRVLDDVRHGRVELGFVESPGALAGVRHAVVAWDTLTVVVAPGHPWTRRRGQLPAAVLAATALITRERGSGTREALQAALATAGLEATPPVLELGSSTAVKRAVLDGAGPAVLSRLAVSDELSSGRLVEVPVTGVDLSRALRAVWTGAAPTDMAATLLRCIPADSRVEP